MLLLSPMNTSTKFQATVIYKKIEFINLILILTMIFQRCVSILLKWLIWSKRKHQKEKNIWKTQEFTFGQLWIHKGVLFTSYSTLQLYNGFKSFCKYSSLPFHHQVFNISRTIRTQFPFPCSYFFHIRCLFSVSWHSEQPSLTVSCIYTSAHWLLTCV